MRSIVSTSISRRFAQLPMENMREQIRMHSVLQAASDVYDTQYSVAISVASRANNKIRHSKHIPHPFANDNSRSHTFVPSSSLPSTPRAKLFPRRHDRPLLRLYVVKSLSGSATSYVCSLISHAASSCLVHAYARCLLVSRNRLWGEYDQSGFRTG